MLAAGNYGSGKVCRDAIGAAVPVVRGVPSVIYSPMGALGGYSQFNKSGKAEKIVVPDNRTAEARVVRFHERMHVVCEPAELIGKIKKSTRLNRLNEYTWQICLDVWIHTGCIVTGAALVLPRQLFRDLLAVGSSEMRKACMVKNITRPDNWDSSILCACRAMALVLTPMWIACGSGVKRWHHDPDWFRRKAVMLGKEKLGSATMGIFADIIDQLRCMSSEKIVSRKGFSIFCDCCEMLDSLMLNNKEPSGRPDSPQILDPRRKNKTSPLNVSDKEMCIIEPPRMARANGEIGDVEDDCSGELNIANYVDSITSGEVLPLFTREDEVEAQGTILLDASGSMGITTERLNKLAATLPGAVVAFYSGSNKCRVRFGTYGALVVYSRDGYRMLELPDDLVYGGNACDNAALQWLEKQPGPRLYVGDRQFCGGASKQDVRAKARVASMKSRRSSYFLPSYEHLEIMLDETNGQLFSAAELQGVT